MTGLSDDRFARAERIVAHDGPHAFEAVVPPIVQTSLFTFATVADMVETYAGRRVRDVYSRTTNPTVSAFEAKMAALEGADDAIGFPSGMAAISGAVLAFVRPGDRILCVRDVYPDAYRLFETLLKEFGVSVAYVDGGDLAAVAAALPGAMLLYLESPTSWTMEAHDVAGLAALARRYGALSMIDNSWATPVFQQPLALGVDLVLHSASKYIGGHSDVVAGVVAGRAELVGHIRRTICPYVGAKLAPFEAWLLLRGLRTLPSRLRQHERSALALAERLEFGVSVAYVDGGDLAAVAAALPGARLLYLESPTSWTMEAHDVAGLAALARRHGALSMIDNSWATPVFQQPLVLGVDLVLHSASKYIGGHSDVVAGVVAGRAELVGHIRRTICPYIGAKLAPFEAWLLLRGLRTLPSRLRQHERSALALAERLAGEPSVASVHHPAFGQALPPGLDGTSGLFSFVFDETVDITAFCDALHLFKLGVSWGGHESLVVPALVTRVQAAGPNSAVDFGVPERMVRLHVGLEGTEALWDDLARALTIAKR